MGVNSLPKTVTRQRRDCDLNPSPSAPESKHADHSATEPPYNTTELCRFFDSITIRRHTAHTYCSLRARIFGTKSNIAHALTHRNQCPSIAAAHPHTVLPIEIKGTGVSSGRRSQEWGDPRNWVHKKIPGCAVELNTQNCAWFGSQISLITAMSFREAMPPEPPTRGSAPGPRWGMSVPQTPTSKSWLRHWPAVSPADGHLTTPTVAGLPARSV